MRLNINSDISFIIYREKVCPKWKVVKYTIQSVLKEKTQLEKREKGETKKSNFFIL